MTEFAHKRVPPGFSLKEDTWLLHLVALLMEGEEGPLRQLPASEIPFSSFVWPTDAVAATGARKKIMKDSEIRQHLQKLQAENKIVNFVVNVSHMLMGEEKVVNQNFVNRTKQLIDWFQNQMILPDSFLTSTAPTSASEEPVEDPLIDTENSFSPPGMFFL
jgi:hypothetical protein